MGEPLDDRKLPKAKKPVVDAGAGNGDYKLIYKAWLSHRILFE